MGDLGVRQLLALAKGFKESKQQNLRALRPKPIPAEVVTLPESPTYVKIIAFWAVSEDFGLLLLLGAR